MTTYILVKKMLFAMTILRLKDDSLIKQVFKERSKCFRLSTETATENGHNSPFYEILKTVLRMDVSNLLYDMCTGTKDILSMRKWSSYIWENAWLIEDLYWGSTSMLYKDNDLLAKAIVWTKYLT